MTKGYELFLPAIAAVAFPKKKSDDHLNEPEFVQVVAVTFRDAVTQFMKDSLLYRIEMPVDLYKDVKRYELTPPNGWLVEDVVGFKTYKTHIPDNSYDNENLWLTCCPTRDIEQAFYVELALIPKRSHNCKFDEDFLERYYDVIMANMMMRFSAMTERSWRSFGVMREHQREYKNKLGQAKRRSMNDGGKLYLKSKRISDG